MSFNNPNPGPSWTPEYQASGIPWVTASNVSGYQGWDFPFVTRAIIVKNLSAGNIRFGFTELGLQGTNYFQLAQNESQRVEVRIKTLIVSGSGQTVNICAELTQIQSRFFPVLTGSTGTEGIG